MGNKSEIGLPLIEGGLFLDRSITRRAGYPLRAVSGIRCQGWRHGAISSWREFNS